jgi:hypothetical protein
LYRQIKVFVIYTSIQGESKKTDTFDIQMNNKGVSFFWLTLYIYSAQAKCNVYPAGQQVKTDLLPCWNAAQNAIKHFRKNAFYEKNTWQSPTENRQQECRWNTSSLAGSFIVKTFILNSFIHEIAELFCECRIVYFFPRCLYNKILNVCSLRDSVFCFPSNLHVKLSEKIPLREYCYLTCIKIRVVLIFAQL